MSRPRFQADEDFNAKIIAGLLRRERAIDFQTAKAANLYGLSDPEVLTTAQRDGRIVVSHDCDTMPAHFERFCSISPSPGMWIVSDKIGIGQVIEELPIVGAASEAEEWVDRMGFLPFQ